MNVLSAVVQVLDFLYKAVIAFARTPEGEKELADIEVALGLVNSTGDISISPDETPVEADQPTQNTRVVRPNSGG